MWLRIWILKIDFLVLNHSSATQWLENVGQITSLGLSFSMCKMEVKITAPTLEDCCEDYMNEYTQRTEEFLHTETVCAAVIITISRRFGVWGELKETELITKFCLSGERSCSLWAFCFACLGRAAEAKLIYCAN